MATLQEKDHTGVDGADRELSTPEDSAEEDRMPERRLVDALLDISQENFLKELKSYEYHCLSGWEEVGRGWARVAPMSCTLLASKTHKKPKRKDTGNVTPSSDDPAPFFPDHSASIADQCCKPHVDVRNFNQPLGFWCETDETSDIHRNLTQLSLEEKTKEGGMHSETLSQHHCWSSKQSVLENKPAKHQKQSHRPNSVLVPIKTFTFSPHTSSPHLWLPKQRKEAFRGTNLGGQVFPLKQEVSKVHRIFSLEEKTKEDQK